MPADPCFSRFRSEPFASPIVIVIAPLTRMCAVRPGDAPQPLNAEYYSQRTSEGGLRRLPIYLTRGRLSRRARQSTRWGGRSGGWQAVTQAVHAKGGFIFVQLWYTGSISHSSMQPSGAVPVAPSSIAGPGNHVDVQGNPVPFQTPRALAEHEIPVSSHSSEMPREAPRGRIRWREVHAPRPLCCKARDGCGWVASRAAGDDGSGEAFKGRHSTAELCSGRCRGI